jgi:hypothetical protein
MAHAIWDPSEIAIDGRMGHKTYGVLQTTYSGTHSWDRTSMRRYSVYLYAYIYSSMYLESRDLQRHAFVGPHEHAQVVLAEKRVGHVRAEQDPLSTGVGVHAYESPNGHKKKVTKKVTRRSQEGSMTCQIRLPPDSGHLYCCLDRFMMGS